MATEKSLGYSPGITVKRLPHHRWQEYVKNYISHELVSVFHINCEQELEVSDLALEVEVEHIPVKTLAKDVVCFCPVYGSAIKHHSNDGIFILVVSDTFELIRVWRKDGLIVTRIEQSDASLSIGDSATLQKPFLWFDYASQYFAFLHGSEVVRVLVSNEGQLSVSDSFSLDVPSNADVINVQQEGSFLFLLHPTGDISIFNSKYFYYIAKVCFREFIQTLFQGASGTETLLSQKASRFAISPCLSEVIITFEDSKYSIFRINLNEYFERFPSHIFQNESGKSEVQRSVQQVFPLDQSRQTWQGFMRRTQAQVKHRKKRRRPCGYGPSCSCNKLWVEKFSQPASIFPPTRKDRLASKVTGFVASRKKPPERVQQAGEAFVHSTALKTPKHCKGLLTSGVRATDSSILVWYQGDSERHGGMCTISTEDNKADFHSFPEQTFLASAVEPAHPMALITRDKLQLLALGADQDILVNKLMIYKNASLAESVSQLNQWDHCSIPIHALEVGLRHRQLDTVAFFLKGRETEFRFKEVDTKSPRSTQTRRAGESQLWIALDLLSVTIADNVSDPQSRQYAWQLLNLTLTHLQKLVQNVTGAMNKVSRLQEGGDLSSGHSSNLEDLNLVTQKLMGYITTLRRHLKDYPAAAVRVKDGDDSDETDSGAEMMSWVGRQPGARRTIQRWKKLSVQGVIKDAIISQLIPQAQAFLHEHHSSHGSRMQDFVRGGQSIAYSSLMEGDIATAVSIFHNMGFDVSGELKKICFFTANSPLRDTLVQRLQETGHISPQEKEICLFITRLERLYTCQSFEKARALAEEGLMSLWEGGSLKLLPLRDEKSENFLQETLKTGEIVTSSEMPNCENFNYAHILLEWVRSWDKNTQDRILLEKLIHSKSRDLSTKWDLAAESAWTFLLAHEDWVTLKCWIEQSFLTSDDPSCGGSLPQIAPILQDLMLERDFVNRMENCTGYFRERVLDEMASYGVFCHKELSDFNLLLTRLVRSGQLLASPHSLSRMPESQQYADPFNQWFINYCIHQHLPAVLYLFIEFFSLCLSENEVITMQLPLTELPWLDILLNFRWVGKQATDPALVFQASLANARLFLAIAQPTVASLLEDGRIMIAMATLLYAPGTISEALLEPATNEEKLWKVDSKLLDRSLRPYPKLHAAIYPPEEQDGVTPQDVTVYQLLKGNMPVHHTRVFAWQSSNAVAEKSEATPSEMPHFANASFVKQFAYTESFSFTHYLRQGRPSFAYSAFIVNLIQENGNFTNFKICQAYLKSYCTAIRNISKPPVTAACVAFTEMLGKSSADMRVDIHCATLILEDHRTRLGLQKRSVRKRVEEEMANKEKELELKNAEKELVSLLLSCLRGSKGSARSLLTMVEGAISAKVNQQCPDSTSWEASELWTVAVLFCQRHNLPFSTLYLQQCAEKNQWLQFTCFAQIHQYPQNQVLEAVKGFKNSALGAHLSSAFENMQHVTEQQPLSGLTRHNEQRSTRNIRAKFYARSGVLPQAEVPAETRPDPDAVPPQSEEEDDSSTDEQGEDEERSPEALDVSSIPDDFFGVIFHCDAHPQPHSALLAHSVALNQPIFAVIASCYQSCSPVDCLCTWLLTIINEKARSKFRSLHRSVLSFQWHTWSLDELFGLVQSALETGAISLVHKGFFIFDKNCPLNLFLKFCCEFLLHYDIAAAREQLDSFQAAIQKAKRHESLQQAHLEQSHRPTIGNLQWYQDSANQMAVYMLKTRNSQWELLSLLQLFSEVNFSLIVSSAVPDYNLLYQLNLVLNNTAEYKSFSRLVRCDQDTFQTESLTILERLKDSDHFDEAKTFARLAKIPVDDLIIHQVKKELSSSVSRPTQNDADRLAFWRKCDNLFRSSRTKPKTAAVFFQDLVFDDDSDVDLSSMEKAFVLHLAYGWMKRVSKGPEISKLEKEMWCWRLKVEAERHSSNTTSDEEPLWECQPQGVQELLFVQGRNMEESDEIDISQEQQTALESILSRLLQQGCIIHAHHLADQFDHYCQDLEIIQACIRLAKGAIQPYQLGVDLKRLIGVTDSKRKRRTSEWQRTASVVSGMGMAASPPVLKRSVSVVTMPSNFAEQTFQSSTEDEVMTTMESLLACCNDGNDTCKQIMAFYQISKMLHKPYESVVETSPLDILKELLGSHSEERIDLAKKFVETNSITENEVASFLTDLVLSSLKTLFLRRKEGREMDADNPKSLFQGVVSRLANPPLPHCPWADRHEFNDLLKLCQSPITLGNKLMEEILSLTRSYKDPSKQVLSLEVELLIRSHDCYSLCCHMEGISNVLRSSREIFNALADYKEYPLMVRLLLGVARYSEMTYIFDELRSKQQIELLLKKGSKDNSLKVSLLGYLKRCEPPDPETYNMVAVKFGMVREIAIILEKEGAKKLASIGTKKMDTNLEVQNSLEEILSDFKNAAQNYAKADCLRHAERCVQQARLVALQLHLLSQGVRVVNLSDDELLNFLTKHSNFHHAFIVHEAYRCQFDWSVSILHQVIKQGDFTYFSDYMRAVNINESIFREVSKLYSKENIKDSIAANNMKQFVMLCPDVVAKYRIATELGFQEISSMLLQDENGVYLKDVAISM